MATGQTTNTKAHIIPDYIGSLKWRVFRNRAADTAGKCPLVKQGHFLAITAPGARMALLSEERIDTLTSWHALS